MQSSQQLQKKNQKASTVPMNLQQIIRSQQETKRINKIIFNSLQVGMNNQEARELAIKIFKENNVFKWHDIVIHFGKNTKNAYYTQNENDNSITFQLNDTVFIDIGIVVDSNLEGDFGQTYYGGNDIRFKNLVNMSQYFWQYGRNYWVKNRDHLTGKQLYEYVEKEVKQYGYTLESERGAMGHQVGIFLHNGPKLKNYEGIIKENLWILEILIHDKDIDRGAFYEDALTINEGDQQKL